MSVVVVVKKDYQIAIAADTLTTSYGYIGMNATHKANSEKMVKYKDSWIGSVGAAMGQQMFLQSLKSKKNELSLHGVENIYRTMLQVHKILKREHYLYPYKGAESVESSQVSLLIANSSGIFGVSHDRYVTDCSKFWAIGSGQNFALGAMEQAYATHTAEEIARIGVEAACEFDQYCELPMNIHSIKEDLVKDKIEVVEPFEETRFDDLCDNISLWLKKVKKRINKER